MSQLAHYEARAKGMPTAQLRYAVGDLKQTLSLWRERPTDDPYVAKLLAEFDAYVVELHRRDKRR